MIENIGFVTLLSVEKHAIVWTQTKVTLVAAAVSLSGGLTASPTKNWYAIHCQIDLFNWLREVKYDGLTFWSHNKITTATPSLTQLCCITSLHVSIIVAMDEAWIFGSWSSLDGLTNYAASVRLFVGKQIFRT